MCDKAYPDNPTTEGSIALKHVSESINRQQKEYEKAKYAVQQPLGGTAGCGPSQGTASEYYANPRHLIDQEIEYHNRRANELHALLRALPQEMPVLAEKALLDLVTQSRPRSR